MIRTQVCTPALPQKQAAAASGPWAQFADPPSMATTSRGNTASVVTTGPAQTGPILFLTKVEPKFKLGYTTQE